MIYYLCRWFIYLFVTVYCSAQVSYKTQKKFDRSIERGAYHKALRIAVKWQKRTTVPADYSVARAAEMYASALYGTQVYNDSVAKEFLERYANTKDGSEVSRFESVKYLTLSALHSGNQKKTSELIAVLNTLVSSINESSFQYKQSYGLLYIQNLIEKGYYQQAYDSIENQINKHTDYTNYYSKENPKLTALSKKEKQQYRLYLARLLALRAHVLLKKGTYKKLDSLIKIDYQWVKKNVGGNSIEARDLLYVLAQKFEIQKEKRKANHTYVKAFHKSKAKFSEKNVLDILEKVIYSYNALGDKHRSRKYYRKFESALTLEYGKKNPTFLRYHLADVQLNIMRSKYDKAYRKLLKIQTSSLKPIQYSNLHLLMLRYSYFLNTKRSDYEPALDSMVRLVNIKRELLGEDAPEYHMALLELAHFYALNQNKFAEALKIQDYSWTKVVAPQLSGENLAFIQYLEQLALTYDLADKYDRSIEILRQAVDNVEKHYGKENSMYASVKQKTAEQLLKKGQFQEAEQTINESVEILKKVSSRENTADQTATWTTLAKLYSTLGKYEEADEALRKARKSIRKSKNLSSIESSKGWDEQVDFYIKNNRFNDAENLLEKTIYLKEKKFGPASRELLVSINQMAGLQITKGNYGIAEKLIRKASEISTRIFGDSSLKVTDVLKLREELYKKIGEYKKAEETALHVLAIQKKVLGNNHIDLASSYANIALLKFYATNEPTVSIIFLNEALRIVKNNIGVENPQYAHLNTKLASLLIESKNYTRADSLLSESNKLWIRLLGLNNINTAEIYTLQGIIYLRQSQFELSAEKLQEARKIYRSIFSKNHPGYVRATSLQAQSLLAQKKYKVSVKLLREILDTYLSYCRSYFPSLSFSEKAKYWNLIKDDFEIFQSLAIQQNSDELIRKMYDYTIATKAILLSSSIKVRERILNSKDDFLIQKYNDWVARKELLSSVIALSTETQKQLGIDVFQLEKEITLLEKDLSESSEVFASNADKRTFTWKDVRNSLKNNEVAIEIVRVRPFSGKFSDSAVYAALVVSKKSGKAPQMVVLPNGKDLETKYLKYYRNTTKNLLEESTTYDVFWRPIKSIIEDEKLIFLSADGVYNQINLEALKSEEGFYALDKNDFVLVSNTKDIIIRRNSEQRVSANKSILVGNPTFYQYKTNLSQAQESTRGYSNTQNKDVKLVKKSEVIAKDQQREFRSNETIAQLSGTEMEVNQLYEFLSKYSWPARKIMADFADEDTIKAIRSPRIFHIATHGFFKEDLDKSEIAGLSSTESEFTQNPLLRSGLLLKGAGDVLKSNSILDINSEKGVLTAYEAMNLNLDNTDLVVLSACETGLGEVQIGEGVFGLQRSFVVAGAQSVIMSLFKVNDEVTQKLMNLFYEKWLQSGNKQKAFSEAKKEIKKQYPQPIYWGSFVMSGI